MKALFLTFIAVFACRAENPLKGIIQAEKLQASGVDVQAGATKDSVVLRFHSGVAGKVSIPVPPAAHDWTAFKTITWMFTSSSTTGWDFSIHVRHNKAYTMRVHPYADVTIKAALPMTFVTRDFMNNRMFNGYAISSWASHVEPSDVDAIIIAMSPNHDVTLKFGPIALESEAVNGGALVSKPLVDEFGQWIAADWPGKVHSLAELRSAWKKEDEELTKKDDFGYCPYGGWRQSSERATGFFRTAQVDGKWWFVDPDGHLFFSAGMDSMRYTESTPVSGRENWFAKLPPGTDENADFYQANTHFRYGGEQFGVNWKRTSDERLNAWGFNTVGNWSAEAMFESPKIPFVVPVSIGHTPKNWQGFPDAYSEQFASSAESSARQQCGKFRDQSYLLGYFIGNEPHWAHRDLVGMVLDDPQPSATQAFLRQSLKETGDTPAARAELLGTIARKYFEVVCSAIRKADPHHLILGIRFAGQASDAVVRANDVFDVFSVNIYKFEPPADQMRHFSELSKRPVLIGEFHFGASERGLAPSLVEVKDQTERGVAYQHYMEHAAALPMLVGAHYFALVDEPVTGRFDGENYNFGFVDQTDIPYAEIVKYAKATHRRIYTIRAGKAAPTDKTAQVR
jgi:hypothetical protein